MLARVKLLKVIVNKDEWDGLLDTINQYDFYHTYDYHNLSKANNESAVLLKYTQDDITIAIPLLIREIYGTIYKDATSVYGYAGPIFKGNIENLNTRDFNQNLKEFFTSNNVVSVFSRLNPFIKGQRKLLANLGIITNQGKVVNIDITKDVELQRQVFQSRLKTHINKARRLCTVKIASTKNDLKIFRDIYYENMRRVNAKKYYFFSDDYFKKITTSTDFKSEILLAIDNEYGTVIAGCLFITTNGIVQYHLSGSKNEFLNLMPTKLLIDEMRLIATERGDKFFNLGGGLGGSDDDSLFNFKSSFSKDFKDFNLWKFIVNQDVYDSLVAKKGVDVKSDYFPLYRAIDDLTATL